MLRTTVNADALTNPIKAKNNTNKIVYNDNKNCVNMYYIINNYTEANNFETMMNLAVTDREESYIKGKGVVSGGYQLLHERCISGIDIDKRPFHCVDNSRNKYMLRTGNDWKVDHNGNKILSKTINKIRKLYDTNITRKDSREDRDRKLKNINQLLNFEGKGKKRLLRQLNKVTLLKNTIDRNNK